MKAIIVIILILLIAPVMGQEQQKVVPLEPADSERVRVAYEAVKQSQLRLIEMAKQIEQKYLAEHAEKYKQRYVSGTTTLTLDPDGGLKTPDGFKIDWIASFEFSDDFKYLLPLKKQPTYTLSR